jgi:hypothetical protein
MSFIDLDGEMRSERGGTWECGHCKMPTYRREYHPHGACVMFLYSSNTDYVRAALRASFEFGLRVGVERATKKRKDIAKRRKP